MHDRLFVCQRQAPTLQFRAVQLCITLRIAPNFQPSRPSSIIYSTSPARLFIPPDNSLPAGDSPRVVSDAAQRPLLQSGGEMTTTTITYTYDALYRLTNATYSTGDVFTYTYR